MRRLFYKVFAIFCVVIVCSVAFTSASFWLVQNNIDEVKKQEDGHRKSELLGNALAVFYLEGEEGLNSLQDNWQRRKLAYTVYVVDEDGHDLLDREISQKNIKIARQKAAEPNTSSSARIVTNDLGEEYLFFVINPDQAEPPPLETQKKWVGTFAFILSGLAMAYYLARYLEKPISVLHNGFGRLAAGHLDTRIKKNMGRRKDEISLLANDFDHMAEKLQGLVESQQHLLHHVSHEMRSPLARLQAIVDLARQQPEQAAKNLARIEAELDRMEKLVSELLTLARLESKSADIPEEMLNLNKILEQLVEECAELAQKNQQHILLTLPDTNILIQGNEALLYRAFDNIIRNACNYSGNDTQIQITLTCNKQNIQLDIQDSGKGINEEELPYLFEPFYRGSTNQHIKGTGLGLAITKQIIQRHHGVIAASNIAPHGFNISITFAGK